MGWILKESASVFAVHWCTPKTKWEKNGSGFDFPIEMFCYVECQAACFDWLCCLLPDSPSLPSQSRGGHTLKYDELGGLWHPGIVTGCLAQLLSSSAHLTLSIIVCICSFPLLWACLPCRQTHVNTRSARWAQTCWTLRRESPSSPPSTTLGSTPRMLLNFSTVLPRSSCGISDDSVLVCSPRYWSRPQEAVLA